MKSLITSANRETSDVQTLAASVNSIERKMNVDALRPNSERFVPSFSECNVVGPQNVINETIGRIADALDAVSSLQLLPLVPSHANTYFAIARSK